MKQSKSQAIRNDKTRTITVMSLATTSNVYLLYMSKHWLQIPIPDLGQDVAMRFGTT